MLFPPTTDPRPACGSIDRAPTTYPGALSSDRGPTVRGQLQHQPRRNLPRQPSFASFLQSPRASNIARETGSRASSTSSPLVNSPGPRPHFYASSAPSSGVNLQHENNHRTRPPVPLFSNSTGNMISQTPSQPSQSFVDGTLTPLARSPVAWLTRPDLDLSPGLFDFPANFGVISPDASPMVSFDSMGDVDLQLSEALFASVTQQTPASVSTSIHTVSPKDLMLDNMSAPPSTTMTNLTTPGTNYMESPSYMIGSTDTSPLFANDNLDSEADHWPSLFDDEPNQENDNPSGKSPVINTHVAPRMSRYGSSPGQSSSRDSHQGRHSSTSGVSAKRRDKPLPAITIDDPTDIVAVKRARNTMAARKSRQKRVERNEELMNMVAELEKKVDYWKQIALSRGHVEQ